MTVRFSLAALLLTGLLSFGVTAPVEASPILNVQNGHYYETVFAPNGINWNDANVAAQSMSHLGIQGHLLTVTSAAENNFVGSNLVLHNFWLGGFQPLGSPEPAGGWQWVTGEQWLYTNWNLGEPNNQGGFENYLHFFGSNVWNDITGSDLTGGYIVEYSTLNATPEPATMALLGLTGLGALGLRLRRRQSAQTAA
jgi:hypothetical protein